MSFDRPGLDHPGRKGRDLDVDETLEEEGLDVDEDGELEDVEKDDHRHSSGPQPTAPRRPAHDPVAPRTPAAPEAPTPPQRPDAP